MRQPFYILCIIFLPYSRTKLVSRENLNRQLISHHTIPSWFHYFSSSPSTSSEQKGAMDNNLIRLRKEEIPCYRSQLNTFYYLFCLLYWRLYQVRALYFYLFISFILDRVNTVVRSEFWTKSNKTQILRQSFTRIRYHATCLLPIIMRMSLLYRGCKTVLKSMNQRSCPSYYISFHAFNKKCKRCHNDQTPRNSPARMPLKVKRYKLRENIVCVT